MRSSATSAIFLVALVALAAPATAAINRCTDADGVPLFSDKPCSAEQATDRLPPLTRNTPKSLSLTFERLSDIGIGCPAHHPEAMVDPLRRALASRDPNRLASLYDWRNSSRAGADRQMQRFREMVKREPLAIEVDRIAVDTLEPTARLEQPDVASDAGQPLVTAIRVEYASAPGAESGPSEYFRFVPRGNCLWLRP